MYLKHYIKGGKKIIDDNIKIYETYKNSRILENIDLAWLSNKLDHEELKYLKRQISYLILEAEEEAFITALYTATNTSIGA